MEANNIGTFYKTILTTFITVFIAELGDKTQVATLLLSADTGKPFIVFIAASLALIISSLIGVIMGKFLSSKINPTTFNKIAGIIMILLSLVIIIQFLNETKFLQGLI